MFGSVPQSFWQGHGQGSWFYLFISFISLFSQTLRICNCFLILFFRIWNCDGDWGCHGRRDQRQCLSHLVWQNGHDAQNPPEKQQQVHVQSREQWCLPCEDKLCRAHEKDSYRAWQHRHRCWVVPGEGKWMGLCVALTPTSSTLACPKISSDDRYGHFWGCISITGMDISEAVFLQ